MAEAVICRPVTAETRVQSWAILCGVCGEDSGSTANGDCPSLPPPPRPYLFTNAPYTFIQHRRYAILATDGVVKLYTYTRHNAS